MENKITFEDLQKANETIKTTDIKGKDYAEVNQRIKAFRMVYPKGCISTEILNIEDGVVIMKCTVLDEEGDILATGTAYEKENSTFINKTSYIENCETSAVGRALGMAGFGIDTSVASYEEVQNAIANQNQEPLVNENMIAVLTDKAKAINNVDTVKNILAGFGYTKLKDVKVKDFKAVCDDFSKLTKKISEI